MTNHLRSSLLLLVFLVSACTSTRPAAFDTGALRDIDTAIDKAIADHRTPGGVFHLERNGAIYERSYGNRALVPDVEPATIDTIYDAASLTKVVATAPAIWLLIQRGQLSIDDPVQLRIPEYGDPSVTIRHLLTHTSGLRPSLDLDTPWSGHTEGIARAIRELPRNRPGIVFRYSDINFILLGEIVERVSGVPLNTFVEREIFAPLAMRDTRFLPEPDSRIAPTETVEDGRILRGTVHDPTARRMGGVAGHAGLFTTVRDLAIFARMFLTNHGLIFKPEIVKMMTSLQSPDGVAVRRAGGFDLDSGYSRPRGDLFPLGSFGHTGWTGGFFWIDPWSRTFYVFLSNRVHPDGKGSVVALQRTLGTLAATTVSRFDLKHVPGALQTRPGGRVGWVTGGANASNGIDAVVAKRYAPLQGMRIGLITNQTAIDRSGNPTADLLRSASNLDLVSLFSPEHGIRGTVDAKVPDSIDPISGLPVFSLYNEERKPKPEQLQNLDALVFDIQDIGTRFYTYISTLGLAMEAAAESKTRFIVLDRVNPIGGSVVEGPVRKGETAFTAYHDIPIRHGMTVGELAMMFRDERKIDVDLQVIKVERWTRSHWQDEAGLPWINTSPNMRSLQAAALYPGIGLLESAISVGRGTATPFEIAGAPYIDPDTLMASLEEMKLPGIRFTPVRFTPDASVFKGETCGGVRMEITDRTALRSVTTGIAIAVALRRLYPDQFALDKIAPLLRDPRTLEAIRDGQGVDEIVSSWKDELDGFLARRSKYLLY